MDVLHEFDRLWKPPPSVTDAAIRPLPPPTPEIVNELAGPVQSEAEADAIHLMLPYGHTAIKHPVPDRVKPQFVIFDIRAFWRSALSVRVPRCQKLQLTA